MNLKIKTEVLGNEKSQLIFETSTTTQQLPSLSDLIGLIDATSAWLEKQKTELEKLPQTQTLTFKD